jgi:hypothetical protein
MKGEPVPDSDHVVRYVGARHIDGGVIHGGAFLARQKEKGPSVNWLECFWGGLQQQLAEVRQRTRLRYGASARLARLLVGNVRAHVAGNAPDGDAIAILQDPLDADPSFAVPADPSHAVMDGVPSADHPAGELIGDLIAQCIEDTYPARAPIVREQP